MGGFSAFKYLYFSEGTTYRGTQDVYKILFLSIFKIISFIKILIFHIIKRLNNIHNSVKF